MTMTTTENYSITTIITTAAKKEQLKYNSLQLYSIQPYAIQLSTTPITTLTHMLNEIKKEIKFEFQTKFKL